MKQLARRAFLRMLPAGVVAGPAAARAAAEQAAAKLAGMDIGGLGAQAELPRGQYAPATYTDRAALMTRALRVPAVRAELTSLLFEEHRRVGFIDPDIANKRSFSLAAKITFQRQRNVERDIEFDLLEHHPWGRKSRLFERLARDFFGGGK